MSALRGGKPNTVAEALEGGLKAGPPAGPGTFKAKDIAFGVNEDLAYFRGEAKIGIDLKTIGDEPLLNAIFRGVDETVSAGGTIRFNLDRMDLKAAFKPGIATDRFGKDVFESYTSRELRRVLSEYSEHARFYLGGAEVSLKQVRKMAGL